MNSTYATDGMLIDQLSGALSQASGKITPEMRTELEQLFHLGMDMIGDDRMFKNDSRNHGYKTRMDDQTIQGISQIIDLIWEKSKAARRNDRRSA